VAGPQGPAGGLQVPNFGFSSNYDPNK
jgi:hypothetical protein